MTDLAIVAVVMLGGVALTLAVLAWQEHEEAARQRKRAEEMTAWADEHLRLQQIAQAEAHRWRARWRAACMDAGGKTAPASIFLQELSGRDVLRLPLHRVNGGDVEQRRN